MYILGIHCGHNSTAALLENGKIIGCVSEERFNRKKNFYGFPSNSINFLLNSENISIEDIDKIIMCGRYPAATLFSADDFNVTKKEPILSKVKRKVMNLESDTPLIRSFSEFYIKKLFPIKMDKMRKSADSLILKHLNANSQNYLRIDHHLAHAAAAYYGFCDQSKPYLIFTADGGGDGLCATVSIAKNGQIKRIAQTDDSHSLGMIYAAVTEYLGMKPLEHEYKVMGLAPYTKPEYIKKTYEVFKKILRVNEDKLTFETTFRTQLTYDFLKKNLEKHRFDSISGAAQKFVEDILIQWIRAAIKKTGIHNIALGGGVFMNVKANMLISHIPEVKDIRVCPSCGDESLPIGATYWGFKLLNLKDETVHIHELYLGPEFSDKDILEALNSKEYKGKFKIKKSKNIERDVAKLLAKNKVVARCTGRMEWGARSLGNRAILAHPASFDTVKIINEQIKGRDFWMPFAPSILKESAKKYVVNPKNINGSFMIMAFNSTPLAHKTMRAAMHPYDLTIRPQIVSKENNPRYHKLIREFEKLTGTGAVLNTSFNLHGDPVVCSPKDALYTLKNSGLEYLTMNDFLISKKTTFK